MHRTVVLALVVVCGCASSGSSASRTQTLSVEGAGSLRVNAGAEAVVKPIAYPMDRVWRVLPAVFDSLGIPVTRLDAASHTIANEGAKGRVKLKGVYFSNYIDCGATQIGQNADSYDIFFTLTTQVKSTGPNSATVSTLFDAASKPVTFNQDYSRCSSKGILEDKIAALVRAKLVP